METNGFNCKYQVLIDFVTLTEKLRPITNTRFAQLALVDRPKRANCSTLVHGDLWLNNVLFDRESAESNVAGDRVCALIDFQTVFIGNPLYDLAYMLASSTNAEVRREHSRALVDRYYDALVSALKSHGQSARFSRIDAHENFELCLLQLSPILAAYMCFFGSSLKLKNLPSDVVDHRMSIIARRTRAVLEDAVELMEKPLCNNLTF